MSKPTSQINKQAEALREKDNFSFLKDTSDAVKKQMNVNRRRISKARNLREMPYREFDNLTLTQVIQACRDARVSYLKPVKNDGEVQVTTGVTEGKLDAVWNVTYNQNIEAEVLAYNEFDAEDDMLGDALTKAVYRTNQMESDDDFWYEFIGELSSMPAVFIQEVEDHKIYYNKTLPENTSWYDAFLKQEDVNVTSEEWYTEHKPKKVLWSCDQVYLADPTIPAWQIDLQPFIVTHRVKSYDFMKGIYKDAKMWEYVKAGQGRTFSDLNTYDTSPLDWRLAATMEGDEVEEVVIKDLQNDEIQIYLNGVPMLPAGTPMRSRYKTYDLKMYVPKPIHANFAYGRPITMQTRVLQALHSENFRLMLLKYRQSIFKPIVTRANTTLSKDMWLPGKITQGVSKADLEAIAGESVNGSDFGMSDMVEKEIEKMVNINPLIQGASAGNRVTAEEVAQRMKQALIMIGSVLVMYMRAKRDMTYLRVYNLIENFTYPVGERKNDFTGENEDIFMSFTLNNSDVFDGGVGKQIVQFMDRDLLQEEIDFINQLEQRAKVQRKPVRHSFVNVNKLRQFKYYFEVVTTQKEKNSSLLQRETAKKDLFEAVQFGAQIGRPVDPDYATSEFAKRTSLDPNRLFSVPQPGTPGQPGAEGGAGNREQMMAQLKEARQAAGAPRTVQTSVQTLANADSNTL